jgi:hypothetical protein
MRRFVAALIVGIALAGAVYLGSLRLGTAPIFICINTGFSQPPQSACSARPTRPREGWQIPVSILIGVLGVAGGLVVLRRHGSNGHLGSPPDVV